MADSKALGVALAVGVGLYALSTGALGAAATLSPSEAGGEAPNMPMQDMPDLALPADWIDYESFDYAGNFIDIQTQAAMTANIDARVAAFLYMIRCSEHVFPRDVVDDMCYWIFFGGTYFEDQSDHPMLTGEKKGIPLDTCRAAGFASGVCVSTAAGAYQIIVPTWRRVRAQAPALPDFTQASQDEAATRLLRECGAYPYIVTGDITTAIHKASKLWASLPGSTAQQNPKSEAFALARYNEFTAQA